MQIKQGLLDAPEVQTLLKAHLEDMQAHSPPESVHAFDDTALRAPEVSFLTAWRRDTLLGCGALHKLDGQHGELKSMRTVSAHLRKGVAAFILNALIDLAQEKGLSRLSLETGTPAAFDPARAFYTKHGFVPCAAFADYPEDDPYSTFMTRKLSPLPQR